MAGSGETGGSSGGADGALIEAFRSAATAVISDNLSRLPGCVGLRPFHGHGRTMVGTALTVRTAAGDNRMIHKALDLVRPGHVIVVDGGGDISRALVGEIMANIALSRGAAGFVLDGAIRDASALAVLDLPIFARAAIHRGPYKNGPGDINVPVSVGGMVVSPEDIVVGDADGVVAFPQAIAPALLEAVRAQEAREADIMRSIADGTYAGAYAR
ncbi:RraA family protein [Enterovirga sp.]|uniref:RraA family protein n=1 Tax=Enterovirga sp. TaxID=2026350 RepID=UPI002CE1257B|nr:RraA family protein [Enterovirga sp.]HMO29377.1 RraA family protein [Enterovirga sp.]